MDHDLQTRVTEAMRNPQNLGELKDADAVGAVGNAGCGEMMQMWIKFKDENGKKVIDRATFQSFGCGTAIAVASLATEMIRGKTPAEALSMNTETLAGELGPLPPMKIHCAQLVEAALHSALEPGEAPTGHSDPIEAEAQPASSNLLASFTQPQPQRRIVLLPQNQPESNPARESSPERPS
jgi:NifU-like protein involved in Fe-S cluster formation